MNFLYVQDGHYDNFNCAHKEVMLTCKDIDIHYREEDNRGFMVVGSRGYNEDGKEPIIAHSAPVNSQAVCIYSPLNAKRNYWYCADSQGKAGYTKINPGGKGYCVEGESAACPPLEDALSKLPKQEIKPPEAKTSEEKITLEDETVNWQIYRNEEYGFEFQYPKEWNIEEESAPDSLGLHFTDLQDPRTKIFSLTINRWIEIGADSALAGYQGEKIAIGEVNFRPTVFRKNTLCAIIGGFCVDKNLSQISPVFPACEQNSGNFYYQFLLDYRSGDRDEDRCNADVKMFTRILSTFRFTEEIAQNETADWKTYRNEEYGFEVKLLAIYEEAEPGRSFLKGEIVKSFHYQDANYLHFAVFQKPFAEYKLIDNPGGFIFYFDVKNKEWLNENGTTSKFVPKKANLGLEAYVYKSGDINCSWDWIVIPHPSYSFVVEIAETTCSELDVTRTPHEYIPALFDLKPEQILSTFKFIEPKSL